MGGAKPLPFLHAFMARAWTSLIPSHTHTHTSGDGWEKKGFFYAEQSTAQQGISWTVVRQLMSSALRWAVRR